MKVAIAYLTKDRVELTKQTFPALTGWKPATTCDAPFHLFWMDGSTTEEGRDLHVEYTLNFPVDTITAKGSVGGGADAAIVYALTTMLADSREFTHVGLCENDVLLAPGWFERTLSLFESGAVDGLEVGAVSARCYEDRILVQRDGYAVVHNLGAGHVVFSRRAAELILANYRTGWWPDNRALFAQLSGIDIGRYACFRGNAQWTTADWHFDAILAQHGLASLGCTPALCDMIGQEPSLEEQGLWLVREEVNRLRNDEAFHFYAHNTKAIREGHWLPQAITAVHRSSMNGGASLTFPHQLCEPYWEGDWRLRWAQGFGPFAWRANADGAIMQVEVFGPAVVIVSGDKRSAKIKLQDLESGYEVEPEVPPAEHGLTQLAVPGHFSYRPIKITCGEGAVFYGIQTQEPQPLSTRKFDYSVLPPV